MNIFVCFVYFVYCSYRYKFESSYAARKLSSLLLFFFCKPKASKHFLLFLFLVVYLNYLVLNSKRKELKWKKFGTFYSSRKRNQTLYIVTKLPRLYEVEAFVIVSRPDENCSKRDTIKPEPASYDMISCCSPSSNAIKRNF